MLGACTHGDQSAWVRAMRAAKKGRQTWQGSVTRAKKWRLDQWGRCGIGEAMDTHTRGCGGEPQRVCEPMGADGIVKANRKKAGQLKSTWQTLSSELPSRTKRGPPARERVRAGEPSPLTPPPVATLSASAQSRTSAAANGAMPSLNIRGDETPWCKASVENQSEYLFI